MRNDVQTADTITVTAPAVTGATSGGVGIYGNLVGIFVGNALPGADIELALTGAYRLPKAAGALTLGTVVTWSGTAVETAGATDLCLGVVIKDAAADATEAIVRLGHVNVTMPA